MPPGIRLPGPKIVFYAPFPASKKAKNDTGAAPLDRLFARVLCKDSIGTFLGFGPAPYRASIFKKKATATTAPNVGKTFAINEKVSAKPFKFYLVPGTIVKGAKINYAGGIISPIVDFTPKSISVWFPGHVTVADVLFWINSGINGYQIGGTGALQLVPGQSGGAGGSQLVENLKKILAVVTPRERKYNVRTILVPNSRPMIRPLPAGTPAPSPAPSPAPTP